MRILLMAAIAVALAGCTMSQEVKNQCLAMGFQQGSEQMANCQMRLTEAAMASPQYGGQSAPILPPQVSTQPLPMPQRYGSPAVRVQTNCTTTAYGNMANTNCY